MKTINHFLFTSLCCSFLALGEVACDPSFDQRAPDDNDRVLAETEGYAGTGTETETETEPEAHAEVKPWQVSIQRVGAHGQHSCSGSIVADQWVLTAAHCVADKSVESLLVVAGITDLDQSDSEGQRRRVVRRILAPGYDLADGNRNDVALLRLDSPLEFSEDTSLVSMADSTMPGLEAMESGWSPSPSGELSSVLRSGKVTLLSNEEVSRDYGIVLHEQQLATQPVDDSEGPCWGDDGSPVVVESAGSPRLVGVVSESSSCTDAGTPRVNARVSSFVDWISTEMSADQPAAPNSCEGRCGARAPSGCRCDAQCITGGGCCHDYLDHLGELDGC